MPRELRGTPHHTHCWRGEAAHQAVGGCSAATAGSPAAVAMLLPPPASSPHLAQSARGASCVRAVASRRAPVPASGACHATVLPRVTAVALCRISTAADRAAPSRASML